MTECAFLHSSEAENRILYARHYKPRLVFFYPFFTVAAAYTADNSCTKQGNVGLKSAAYKRERLQIESGL